MNIKKVILTNNYYLCSYLIINIISFIIPLFLKQNFHSLIINLLIHRFHFLNFIKDLKSHYFNF